MDYNYNNGRFEDDDNSIDFWDNSNWLETKVKKEIKESLPFEITTDVLPY